MIASVPIVAPMQCLPESEDPLAGRFFGALVRLMKTSQQEAMQIAGEYDLTLSQMRILFTLDWADSPMAVGELAGMIGLSLAATGRAVDALHRSDVVSRTEDPDDRRVKRVALSVRGVEAVQRIAQARLDAADRFVGLLDEGERTELSSAVDTLEALTERHLPPPFPQRTEQQA